MKKQNSHGFLIFLFVLPLVSSTSARLLQTTLDQETKACEINLKEIDIDHLTDVRTQVDDLWQLMRTEVCADKDEGCLERRMITEAHLDYIYTQHHKP